MGIGVGLVLVLVVGVAVAYALLGGDGSSATVNAGSRFPITQPGPTGEPGPDPDWETRIDCDLSCDLVADARRVFVTTASDDGGDTESEVMAYHASSGEEAWPRPLRLDGYVSVAILEGGAVLVSGGDETIRVDPATGEERWSADGYLSGVSGRVVIVSEYDGDDDEVASIVVDLDSGEELWDHSGLAGTCGSVVVTVDGRRAARVDPRSGDEIWRTSFDAVESEEVSGSYCDDQYLAFASDVDEVTVVAMSDGEEVGTIDVDDDILVNGRLLVADGLVLAMGDGDVVAYARRGGEFEEAWTAAGPEQYGTTYVTDDTLVVIESGEDVRIIDLGDGSSRGRSGLSDDERTVVTTESILVYDDRAIDALRLRDGKKRWSLDVDDLVEVVAGGKRLFVLADDEIRAYS